MIYEHDLAHLGPHAHSIDVVDYTLVFSWMNNKALDKYYEEWDMKNCFRWKKPSTL